MKERIRMGLSRALFVLGVALILGGAIYDHSEPPHKGLGMFIALMAMYPLAYGWALRPGGWSTTTGIRLGWELFLLGSITALAYYTQIPSVTGAWGVAVAGAGLAMVFLSVVESRKKNRRSVNG